MTHPISLMNLQYYISSQRICISVSLHTARTQHPKKTQHTNSVSTLMELLSPGSPQVEDLNNQLKIQMDVHITKQKLATEKSLMDNFMNRNSDRFRGNQIIE